jgi:hypothetical protein
MDTTATTATTATTTPYATLNQALIPQRSLLFYTLTSVVPIVAIAAILLLTRTAGSSLAIIAILCSLVSIVGFVILSYELIHDIAGYPDYKLPIWAVVYMLVYLISGFAFVIFALHVGGPGHHFGGLAKNDKEAFLDALYLSTSNYIGIAPDPSFTARTQSSRFLSIGQGLLSMFLNVVIITKFVGSF